jgi:hypothetical protein
MAPEPGNLSVCGTLALEEWGALIARYFKADRSNQLLASSDDRTPGATTVEWGAYPVRVRNCLQSLSGSPRWPARSLSPRCG